jgi:uncharacterized membrane protein YdjX (TVP38/TMEM64 family)
LQQATPPTDPLKQLSGIGVLGALTLTTPVIGSIALFWVMGASNLGPWLKSHGVLAMIAYAAIFALLTGCALMPTYAMSALGGFAFGAAFGTPAALAGLTGGAALGYLLGGKASGDRVRKVIESEPRWKAVHDALLGESGLPKSRHWWRTLGFIALLRFPPNCPFSFTNLLLSSVRAPFGAYLLGTLTGMAPRTALAAFIGAGVQQMTKDQLSVPTPWLIAGIVSAIAVVMIIGSIAQRALARITDQPAPPQSPDA